MSPDVPTSPSAENHSSESELKRSDSSSSGGINANNNNHSGNSGSSSTVNSNSNMSIVAVDEDEKTIPSSPVSPPPELATQEAPDEQVVLREVNVRIQKRPADGYTTNAETTEYETVKLNELCLPMEPTLEDIREALTSCELGDPGRDIFFPAWTKSLYIMWKNDDETETVETDEALRTVIAREQEHPGSLTLLLQECRNARYSRRRQRAMPRRGFAVNGATPLGGAAAPAIFFKHHIPPPPAPRADRPVYYDRPMAYFGHYIPPMAQYDGYTFMAPPFVHMMPPFMYPAPPSQQ